jgi:hypothetical protein
MDLVNKKPKPTEFAAPASPQDASQAPVLPSSIEKRAGLKRPSRVDLTGLNLPTQKADPPAAQEEPSPAPPQASLTDLKLKGLDYSYGAPVQNVAAVGTDMVGATNNETDGSEMLEDDNALVSPSLRPDEATTHHGSDAQREASMKIGSEYAETPLGHSQSVAPHETPRSADRFHPPAQPGASSHHDASPTANKLVLLLSDFNGSYLPRDPDAQERALAILSQELCSPFTAESVRESDGILTPACEMDESALLSKLRNIGVEARIMHDLPLALQRDPLEVLSLDLLADSLICNSVEMGRLRVPFSSIVLIQESHVRLSRSQTSPVRLLVELICGEPASRHLQLHERTFSVGNSKQSGEPLGITTLEQMADLLVERIGKTKFTHQESDISYVENEQLLKRRVLTTLAGQL